MDPEAFAAMDKYVGHPRQVESACAVWGGCVLSDSRRASCTSTLIDGNRTLDGGTRPVWNLATIEADKLFFQPLRTSGVHFGASAIRH